MITAIWLDSVASAGTSRHEVGREFDRWQAIKPSVLHRAGGFVEAHDARQRDQLVRARWSASGCSSRLL
jgi:hypothetical protein